MPTMLIPSKAVTPIKTSKVVVACGLLFVGHARAQDPNAAGPSSTLEVTLGVGGGSLPKLEVDDYYRGLPRGEKQLMRSAALDVRYLINGPHGVALRLESDDDKRISLFGAATYVENSIIAYDATYVFAAAAPPTGASGLLVELRAGAGGTHASRHDFDHAMVHVVAGCSVGWDLGQFLVDGDFALRWGLEGETEALDAGNVYLLEGSNHKVHSATRSRVGEPVGRGRRFPGAVRRGPPLRGIGGRRGRR